MQEKILFIVEYNDKYGDGNNKSIEVIVESENEFNIWLSKRNAERISDGELEESADEFTLHPKLFIKY